MYTLKKIVAFRLVTIERPSLEIIHNRCHNIKKSFIQYFQHKFTQDVLSVPNIVDHVSNIFNINIHQNKNFSPIFYYLT